VFNGSFNTHILYYGEPENAGSENDRTNSMWVENERPGKLWAKFPSK